MVLPMIVRAWRCKACGGMNGYHLDSCLHNPHLRIPVEEEIMQDAMDYYEPIWDMNRPFVREDDRED